MKVLHYRSHHKEHCVFFDVREGQVAPPEIVVLHVEVPLDGSAAVIETDDVEFAPVEVVRDDGAIDVFAIEKVLVVVSLRALYHEAERFPVEKPIDGQTYKTVKIGDQVWLAENLNFKVDSSFCFKHSESLCDKYGRYYRWAAAVDRPESECGYGNTCSLPSGIIQGVCPSGWHLPNNIEWETLFAAVGGKTGGKALKSATGWNGTDEMCAHANKPRQPEG